MLGTLHSLGIRTRKCGARGIHTDKESGLPHPCKHSNSKGRGLEMPKGDATFLEVL